MLKFVEPETGESLLRPNFLFYGPAKTGKSTAGGTFPGDVLLVNADLPNATRYARAKHPNLKEIEWPEADDKGVVRVFDLMVEVMSLVKAQDAAYAAGTAPTWAAVQVDPIGDLYRRLLEQLSGRAVSPGIDRYLAASVHTERFLRALCDAKTVSAILVAHDYPVPDESNGTVERMPFSGTTGKGGVALSQKLLAMVDVIGYTGIMVPEDGPRQYVAQLVTHQGRRGGERWGGVLGDWRELDLAEWMQVLTEADQAIRQTNQKGDS